ncbi:diaminopimelate epimerase [Micromonospora sp. NPDC000207]|uniref:diaminopimelate epimerase n=1 Tax=Micromonospora sp. NPDC000207 TaxID=3154246 RepID=UPI00332761D2
MGDFVKYHALGNDYLIIDPRRVDVPASGATARLLCDRRYGVGADGLLVGPVGPVTPGEPVELLIFNSDGSPCGRSGNGIRIFADHLLGREPQLGDGPSGRGLTVRTASGTSRVEITTPGTVRITLDAPTITTTDPIPSDPAQFDPASSGPAQFDPVHPGPASSGPMQSGPMQSGPMQSGPVRSGQHRERLLRPLSVGGRHLPVLVLDNGNPHVVVPLSAVDRAVAERWGEPIASHPDFPGRTNVEFLRVTERGLIEIEVWERGAGYTTASGSGACAAASAAHALGLIDDRVLVRMPGGAVEVDIAPDGTVGLTGPVAEVFTGLLGGELRTRLTAERRSSTPVAEPVP